MSRSTLRTDPQLRSCSCILQAAIIRRCNCHCKVALNGVRGELMVLPLQVLSDPEKRRIYDQFGEEGLKGGMGNGSTGGVPGAGAAHFRSMEEMLNEVRICMLADVELPAPPQGSPLTIQKSIALCRCSELTTRSQACLAEVSAAGKAWAECSQEVWEALCSLSCFLSSL